MLLVYVDTGGMLKEVAALEAAGLLKTVGANLKLTTCAN